jgi:hypothetical protein
MLSKLAHSCRVATPNEKRHVISAKSNRLVTSPFTGLPGDGCRFSRFRQRPGRMLYWIRPEEHTPPRLELARTDLASAVAENSARPGWEC